MYFKKLLQITFKNISKCSFDRFNYTVINNNNTTIIIKNISINSCVTKIQPYIIGTLIKLNEN